jgi:hypothetical protein
MKIDVVCFKCSSEADGNAQCFVQTIREDGFYDVRCPKGHEVLVITQTLRHEMLFEIALNAIKDGYYREAVASFAASAERFFEFGIRVLARSQNIQSDTLNNAWDSISQQSERQLGAYIFLYTTQANCMPIIFSNKEAGFRNGIVHKGLLPAKERVIEFGAATYKIIQSGTTMLRDKFLSHVNAEMSERMAEAAQKAETRYPRTCMVTPTALNIIKDISGGFPPFEAVLTDFMAKRDLQTNGQSI